MSDHQVPVPYSEIVHDELKAIVSKFIKDNKIIMNAKPLDMIYTACFLVKEDMSPKDELEPYPIFIFLFRKLSGPFIHNEPVKCVNVLSGHFFQFALADHAGGFIEWQRISNNTGPMAQFLYSYIVHRISDFINLVGEDSFDEVIQKIKDSDYFKEKLEERLEERQ